MGEASYRGQFFREGGHLMGEFLWCFEKKVCMYIVVIINGGFEAQFHNKRGQKY